VVDVAKVVNITTTPVFVPESAFSDDYLAPMNSLKLGAVSSVFEISSNDFTVGVKNEAVNEKISSYEEVSADIRTLLQQQKERTALTNFSQGLLGRALIVIHDPDIFPSQTEEVLPVTEDIPSVTETSADVVSGD
jgi:foldase protein PrsA